MTRIILCNGICNSQYDDYCGMHMSNETCPACEATWKMAQRENEKLNAELKSD